MHFAAKKQTQISDNSFKAVIDKKTPKTYKNRFFGNYVSAMSLSVGHFLLKWSQANNNTSPTVFEYRTNPSKCKKCTLSLFFGWLSSYSTQVWKPLTLWATLQTNHTRDQRNRWKVSKRELAWQFEELFAQTYRAMLSNPVSIHVNSAKWAVNACSTNFRAHWLHWFASLSPTDSWCSSSCCGGKPLSLLWCLQVLLGKLCSNFIGTVFSYFGVRLIQVGY